MKSPTSVPFRSLLLAAALAGLSPFAFADTVITESAGTISEFSPDALVIRSEMTTSPTRYVVSKDVTYVDDSGAPVAIDVVKSGLPVTVHYVTEGERTVARRVVVHRTRTESTSPVVVEKRTSPPAVVERTTTAPAVVERRTTTVAPAPVIEERKSTTTTTTTK